MAQYMQQQISLHLILISVVFTLFICLFTYLIGLNSHLHRPIPMSRQVVTVFGPQISLLKFAYILIYLI